MEKKKELKIALFSKINLIVGIIYFLWSIFGVVMEFSELKLIGAWDMRPSFNRFVFQFCKIAILLYCISFAALIWCSFALKRKSLFSLRLTIATNLTMTVSGFAYILAYSVFESIAYSGGEFPGRLASFMQLLLEPTCLLFIAPVAYALVEIIYLTRPKVKEQFK